MAFGDGERGGQEHVSAGIQHRGREKHAGKGFGQWQRAGFAHGVIDG